MPWQTRACIFFRMLDNLISNAVSYGKKGGYVKIFLCEENGMVKGAVEDDGIGIPEKSLEKIWERFYRVDTSRTGQEHSGLGLSMVKWIVQAHGGEITVESREEKGSRFVFPDSKGLMLPYLTNYKILDYNIFNKTAGR